MLPRAWGYGDNDEGDQRAIETKVLEAMRERFRAGTRAEKGQIANELEKLTGYHRKYCIRLVGCERTGHAKPEGTRARVYDEAVAAALIVLWEASDQMCGKRLKTAIPLLLDSMARNGALSRERRP